MSRAVRTLFIASLLLPSIIAFSLLANRQPKASFLDDPPSDYFSRTSMDDCVQRFYSEPEKFNTRPGVYGGFRAYSGEFQHMAAIGWIRSNGKIDYLCGGSLITDDFVLTAAHCAVDHDNIAPSTIRVGDTDLGSKKDDEYAQQVGIGRIIVHPQYRGSRKYFDLALIQLAEPIEYSETVCSACLWREPSLPSERMDAIGFGSTGWGEGRSPTLMRAEVDKIELSSCVERIVTRRRQMPDGFRDDQFCAVGDDMDTCEGDSGGPIGVKRLNVGGFVVPMVVGVVSFGTPCSAGSSGVYTKISPYIDWIEREIDQTLTYGECLEDWDCLRPQNSTTVNYANHDPLQRFGLIWDDTSPSLHDCGATLIDYQYLLTSASCVTTDRGDPKYVSYDGKERIAVKDVYVSPKYIRGRPGNDVALVKIAKFTNPKVHRPSCLWNRRTDGEWSTNPVVSAYQVTSKTASEWFTRTISIIPMDRKDCKADGFLGSDLIRCHNEVKMVPRLCSLDYGAPVTNVRYQETDPNYIYGVVSSLTKDCGSNLIATDVTPHIDWIESIIIRRRDQMLIFSD
ncbi:serine protease 53-like [Anopheles bellator]|uniref:serine protease 53-like n=1 Tax=Anopheles bellator TaxID=139047 RepID=UPI00264961FF|nr:serine protease 53-like [Anopheles bellator]XP_058064736.1 serine protease 53-like [Anopheles bellator]